MLTEKGKRDNRTLSLSFMLPYSTEEVVKLEVINTGRHVVPVDVAANSKETIDDSQMQMNIYDPNSRVLQVNLPKVEIGDVVHSISRQTITRSFMPGQFAEVNVFEDEGYIRHVSYEVHAPADRPLAAHRPARRSSRHRPLLHRTRPGPHGHPPLGGQQCAAHVRRTLHAARGKCPATRAGQHHARLAGRLQMVLEPEPARTSMPPRRT